MSKHTRYDTLPVYETKDGSFIRELMHPDQHASENQSLAEAVVPPGVITKLHKHGQSEELYFIIQGTAEMTLGDDIFTVAEGDTICIAPETPHCIKNTGTTDLKILCCCSPPYSHEDTVLL